MHHAWILCANTVCTLDNPDSNRAFATADGVYHRGNVDFMLSGEDHPFGVHKDFLSDAFLRRCTVRMPYQNSFAVELIAIQVQKDDARMYEMLDLDTPTLEILLAGHYTPTHHTYLTAVYKVMDCPLYHAYIASLAEEYDMKPLLEVALAEIWRFFRRLTEDMLPERYRGEIESEARFPMELFDPHGKLSGLAVTEEPGAEAGEPQSPAQYNVYEPFVGTLTERAKSMVYGTIGHIFSGPPSRKKSKTTLRWLRWVHEDRVLFANEMVRNAFFVDYPAVSIAMAAMWWDEE